MPRPRIENLSVFNNSVFYALKIDLITFIGCRNIV